MAYGHVVFVSQVSIHHSNRSARKGHFEEARVIVVKYHANEDTTHPIVNLHMSEMLERMQNGGMMTWKSAFGIRNLFNT